MGSGRSLHCPVSFMFELSHQKGTLQTPSWKVPSCSTDVSQEPLQDMWRSITEDVIACSLHVKRSKLLGNLIFLFFFFSQAYMYPCLQVYKGHMYVKISVTPLSWGSCRTQNSPILISETRWLADLSQQLAPGIPPLFLFSARIQACSTCWEFRFWESRLWSWCLSTKPSQPQPDSILFGS